MIFKKVILLSIFFSFALFIYEIQQHFMYKKNWEGLNKKAEYFDPALKRLATMDDFIIYCDSVYGTPQIAKNDSSIYANIVDRTLRYRFYHNYSYYRVGHNYFGYFLAPFIKKDLSAIVLPNDILKCPNAACSQQSIIGMELFRKKGYSVRKVGFFDKKYGGHFCFEANYDDNWHFFDPDKEPNYELLLAFNRPSFAYIHSNHLLLHGLYNTTDKDCVDSLFSKPFYGIANQFPAKNARIYQYVTKFFSYTLWLWLILFYFYFYRPKNK